MKSKSIRFLCAFAILFIGRLTAATATDPNPAAKATNETGIDLYRSLAGGENNLCLSPYSIETALAMTFAGADGVTRDEMARVLHLSKDDSVHSSFSALQGQLKEMSDRSTKGVPESGPTSGPKEPITLVVANRLFAEKRYNFRQSFFELCKQQYAAPVAIMDFANNSKVATKQINAWIYHETRRRIRDLIPSDALNSETRLVLANAIYLKAPWENPFPLDQTKPEPFHVHGGDAVNVPTLHGNDHSCGYAKRNGFVAVTLPYSDNDLHLVILLPDEGNRLQSLEKDLTSSILNECAKLEKRKLNLYLPKFNFTPATLNLKATLQTLGMKTAFDQPRGSANFDRVAPRKPDDYLYISDVFHKTFIAVDENGTEAAAATAAVIAGTTSMRKEEPPLEVRVDRPFFFAIQHAPSGACLFVGRVTDPR